MVEMGLSFDVKIKKIGPAVGALFKKNKSVT